MARYNFQARFLEPILARTKVQTIRRIRPRGPGWNGKRGDLSGHARQGGPVTLCTGSRFHTKVIGSATAQLVDLVTVDFALGHRILHGHMGPDVATERADLDRFAVMDGFADWDDMAAFWRATHDAEHFSGVRIFWGETFVAADA